MSKTLSDVLGRIQQERVLAQEKGRREILARNGITEADLKGPKWYLECEVDTSRSTNDMVQYRLYELKDASTTIIQSMVRSVTTDGIEEMPQVKGKREAYERFYADPTE